MIHFHLLIQEDIPGCPERERKVIIHAREHAERERRRELDGLPGRAANLRQCTAACLGPEPAATSPDRGALRPAGRHRPGTERGRALHIFSTGGST